MTLTIRAFQNEDEQAVIALWRDCGLVVPQNDPAKDIARKLEVDPDLFLVGLVDNAIAATVMGGYEGHRGWINYLAVEPSMQGKGHGRAMMVAIEKQLKDRGCPKINLQVRASNSAALGFYAAIGYLNDNVIGLGKRIESDN